MSYDPGGSIDAFLRKRGSPMAGLGSVFVGLGKKYGVDPRLVVAISGIESGFGKHILGDHNAWGWGPGHPFSSWEEGIATVTKGLRAGYISKGLLTPAQIAGRYAPSSDGNDEANWAKTVSGFMTDLGAPMGTPTAKPFSAKPLATAIPKTDFFKQASLANLQTIASTGRIDPSSMLANLTQGHALDAQAEAQAAKFGGTTVKLQPGSGSNAQPVASTPQLQHAINVAEAQIGKPYVWGGETPHEGFDCSGLIDYALKAAGYPVPGRLTTWSAMKLGVSVKGQPYQPGDLLIVNGGKHMVMYVGNGQVIAAPHSGAVVQYQPANRFVGSVVDVRRI